jgi:hypothetical protein
MSLVTTSPPAAASRVRDVADHRKPAPSRFWARLEALAYAGAAIDPIAALAAQRFARIRDRERGLGRW